jgi:hypothetical protein
VRLVSLSWRDDDCVDSLLCVRCGAVRLFSLSWRNDVFCVSWLVGPFLFLLCVRCGAVRLVVIMCASDECMSWLLGSLLCVSCEAKHHHLISSCHLTAYRFIAESMEASDVVQQEVRGAEILHLLN